MKKRNVLFMLGVAVLLMLITCFAYAEEEEKEVDCVITEWGAGIQLTQPDGSYFTTPFLSNEQLSKVCVNIWSTTPSASNMMLVVYYKDQLIPFSVEDGTETQYWYKFLMEEYGEAAITVSFDRKMLDELIEPGSHIHFIFLGHLTRTAENPYDNFDMDFTQHVAVGGNSEADAELSFQRWGSTPQSLAITHADGVSTKNWVYFSVDNTTPEFTYRIDECAEDFMLFPVLNGELLMENGKPLSFVAKSEDGACSGSLQLTLQEGKNSLFFIQMPIGKVGAIGGMHSSCHMTIIVEKTVNQ